MKEKHLKIYVDQKLDRKLFEEYPDHNWNSKISVQLNEW